MSCDKTLAILVQALTNVTQVGSTVAGGASTLSSIINGLFGMLGPYAFLVIGIIVLIAARIAKNVLSIIGWILVIIGILTIAGIYL